ncbi:MFS transporter [Streptomyces sp. NBC_01361]|uniref:MFS transporter n=1 Tax=Streptomyces sp. NBC_01361 TaxID=2903838 RepID=UPI002E3203DA|nr:MFS transporter [Streptomyces sp. NBC_01361]
MACLGVFVGYFPVTTVSVSLPVIQKALDASTADLSWVSDAFVLPVAALILTAGVFGDVHGRKKVFQAGLGFCAVGAAVALSAHSIVQVWVGQALLGTGAAALLPMTLALISQAVPNPRERGKCIGLWTTSMMGALAVGPQIAGVIVEHVAWRWIYLLPIPLSLVTMLIAAFVLKESKAGAGRKLDWPGQITAALAIVALVYGVIEGGAGSFGDVKVVVALAVAVCSGVAFVVFERRSASPMLDLTLFRSAAFTGSALVAMISFLGLIGFFFVFSLYLGMVQQLSTPQAALRMLMVSALPTLLGAVVGRMMRHLSPRVLITGGLLFAAAALFALTNVGTDTSFGSLAWRLALLGLGLALAFPCITATAVSSVPFQQAGMAAAGNNAFRQIGGALGPAVLGALLTGKAVGTLPAHLAAAGLPGSTSAEVLRAVDADGLGAVGALPLGRATRPALDALSQSFLDGLQLCLVVSGGVMLFGAAVAAVVLRPAKGSAPAAPVASGGARPAEAGQGRPATAPAADVK